MAYEHQYADSLEELLEISDFDIVPPEDNIWSLGTSGKSFKDLHVQNIVYMTTVAGNWSPSADDTYDLGTASLEWKDLYIDGVAYIDDISTTSFSGTATFTSGIAALLANNTRLYFGTNGDTAVGYQTTDADAFALVLGLPHVDEDANNVAVLVLVDLDAIATDLGAGGIDLSGITQPSLVVGDEDSDSYIRVSFEIDDVAQLKVGGSASVIGIANTTAIGTGEGGTTAATGGTIRAPSVIAGGAGDVAGADLTITPGAGTGTGDAGQIIFQTYQVAAAGDNLQTVVQTILTLDEDAIVFVKTMVAQAALTIQNDWGLGFGTSVDAQVLYETADANALSIVWGLPHVDEDANNVAVLVLVDRDAVTTDLGAGGIDLSGITEPTLAVGNEASDAWASFDAGDVNGAGRGLYFKAAADENINIISLSVTGTPTLIWDETQNRWEFAPTVWATDVQATTLSAATVSISDTGSLQGGNADDDYATILARDNTVGRVEVARIAGAADPYVQIGRNDTNVADGSVTDNLYILGGRGAQASANSTGVGIAFYLGNDQTTPENEKRGAINAVLADNTNGAEIAGLELWGMTGGALNLGMTLSGGGQIGVDLDSDLSAASAGAQIFDDYDDALVLKQGIQQQNREVLEDMGILTRKESGSGWMMKLQPMIKLLAGGIYQTREMLELEVSDLRKEIGELRGRLEAVEAG